MPYSLGRLLSYQQILVLAKTFAEKKRSSLFCPTVSNAEKNIDATRAQCFITFYVRNLKMFVKSLGPLKPSLMFEGKAGKKVLQH
jgi:hypothetical protein